MVFKQSQQRTRDHGFGRYRAQCGVDILHASVEHRIESMMSILAVVYWSYDLKLTSQKLIFEHY